MVTLSVIVEAISSNWWRDYMKYENFKRKWCQYNWLLNSMIHLKISYANIYRTHINVKSGPWVSSLLMFDLKKTYSAVWFILHITINFCWRILHFVLPILKSCWLFLFEKNDAPKLKLRAKKLGKVCSCM